jgi:hypothetical protein
LPDGVAAELWRPGHDEGPPVTRPRFSFDAIDLGGSRPASTGLLFLLKRLTDRLSVRATTWLGCGRLRVRWLLTPA